MFSHICPWKPHKFVLKPSEQGLFFWDDWFEGSHTKVYSKKECLSFYLLRNPINVCWNPQNSALFSKTIDLRGHIPRFSWKMNIFPHMSLETLEMCVETLRTGLLFLRRSICGVTYQGLVENECFPTYVLGNPINVCWNPQKRAHFSEMIDLRGHIPRFSWKMNIFPHMSLGNPINVCWNPQNRAPFSETTDLRGHMPRFTLKMNIFPSISCETP